MASETEPAKLLLPYLQRADELQKHEPLVAYYCRLYAMERGLKIPQSERTKTTNSLLVSLMKQLEKDKKSLKLGPEDNLHLEGFALNVFAKADKQDHAGRADLNTAKTFYAASIFFEIINQFGPLQPDLEEKQKYAVWKAADIRKALKEGRKPTPGPPADEEDLSVPSSMPSARYDYGQTESPAASSHPEINTSTQFHEHYDQSSADTPASTQYHENLNRQHSGHIPSPSQFQDSGHIPPLSQFQDSGHIPHPFQFQDSTNNHSTANIPPSASYPSSGYPSHDYHPPPPDTSVYSQTYQHQYSQEPQHYVQQNYPTHETSPYSYPNFQSYPSFTESSLPSVPSHYPSYYQGSDPSYGSQSAQPPKASYSSTSTQYASSGNNGTKSDPSPPLPQKYQYDSNYQPPAEKIAEAHKAARFAVGALAFDDVSVAVDHLRKSLELLTNPSASSH